MNNKITLKNVKEAKTYIPLIEKKVLSELGALLVCEPVEVKADFIGTEGEEKFIPKPNLYVEDKLKKELFLMEIYLTKYFNIFPSIDLESIGKAPIDLNITSEVYDDFMVKGLREQIIKFTKHKEKEVVDKIAILNGDFNEFKEFFDQEIKNYLQIKNNFVDRLTTISSIQQSPEEIKATSNFIKEMVGQIEQLQVKEDQ